MIEEHKLIKMKEENKLVKGTVKTIYIVILWRHNERYYRHHCLYCDN